MVASPKELFNAVPSSTPSGADGLIRTAGALVMADCGKAPLPIFCTVLGEQDRPAAKRRSRPVSAGYCGVGWIGGGWVGGGFTFSIAGGLFEAVRVRWLQSENHSTRP